MTTLQPYVFASVLLGQDSSAPVPAPNPPGVSERIEDRERMVETQIAFPRDRRPAVTCPKVLAAMRAVPRHAMVPRELQGQAYDDTPLPIGYGQTISQPYIVAIMSELLDLSPNDKVLEIGTGSGYQAAVLAHLTSHVYSIEIVEPLFIRTRTVLEEQDYAGRVHLKHGDGHLGWAEHAPFDAIIATCAARHVPPPLWDQLKPGGRIVIPIGGVYEVQYLLEVTKQADGSRRSRAVMPVRFVPLTRSDTSQ
jgi:protein-L-isoaspartate(D-aspartate) O-methyltransferase